MYNWIELGILMQSCLNGRVETYFKTKKKSPEIQFFVSTRDELQMPVLSYFPKAAGFLCKIGF